MTTVTVEKCVGDVLALGIEAMLAPNPQADTARLSAFERLNVALPEAVRTVAAIEDVPARELSHHVWRAIAAQLGVEPAGVAGRLAGEPAESIVLMAQLLVGRLDDGSLSL